MKKATLSLASAIVLSTALTLPTYAEGTEFEPIFFSGGPLHSPVIYKMNTETMETTKVSPGSSVDVSPDGSKLAFVKNDSIYISDENGKKPVRLTNSKFPLYDSSPRWSPDGSKIVFARSDGNLYIIDVSSKTLSQLTNASKGVYHSKPEWSPDGKKIVFHSSDLSGFSHIYTIHADGTGLKQLTGLSGNNGSEFDAHFSPDGSKIVYNASKQGDIDIYVMNQDGSHPICLTADTKDVVSSPVWSADGKKILYTVNEQQESSESRFSVMNRDGSGKKTFRLRVPFATPTDWHGVGQGEEQGSAIQSTISKITNFFFE